MDSTVTSIANPGATATDSTGNVPSQSVSDQKKAAFDMILSAVMNQKPVLADAAGDDGDNDDGSELKIGLAGTPGLG